MSSTVIRKTIGFSSFLLRDQFRSEINVQSHRFNQDRQRSSDFILFSCFCLELSVLLFSSLCSQCLVPEPANNLHFVGPRTSKFFVSWFEHVESNPIYEFQPRVLCYARRSDLHLYLEA